MTTIPPPAREQMGSSPMAMAATLTLFGPYSSLSLWASSTTTAAPSIDDDDDCDSDHTSGDGEGPSHLCRELPSPSRLSLSPSHSTANLSLSLVLDGDGDGFLLHRMTVPATQWRCGTAPPLCVFSLSASPQLDRPHSPYLPCKHRRRRRLPVPPTPSPSSPLSSLLCFPFLSTFRRCVHV
ncbi:hypothetical protein AAHE18_15G176000 [Arachis hypogaea]